MMKSLQPVVRSIALGIVLLGSSCSKKTPDIPAPAPEAPVGPSITGQIQPAGAITGVMLVDTITGQTIIGTGLDSQGAYQFTAVRAGTYDLYFDAWAGYVRPRQRRVTVTAGKTTVVPSITVVQSTGSVTANGAALPAPLVSLSIGFDGIRLPPRGLFSLVFSDDNFSGARGTYRLYLSMPYAVRVGTYSLNGTSAYAIFTNSNTGAFDSRLNPPTVPSGGTLTITAVENIFPYPRSVSGTFSFTGTSPTLGTQTTVSGTFQNAYF